MIFASINKDKLYRQASIFRLSACGLIIPPPPVSLSIGFSHFRHIYKIQSHQPCIFHKITGFEGLKAKKYSPGAAFGAAARGWRCSIFFRLPPGGRGLYWYRGKATDTV
ncbi:hypothetical protein FP2_09720 [Faecalibacterium prausnitzii L2-6]|uniref:Uncharacterized protein n=1 Tax=Faecalibacterium prausnitzii L2-6 TaxID=718252 RepID=D4K4T6_9FIRM|nr:hypothetical protein FP2_09720 [Faecalibacterium prausnitzii L2-6]